MGEVIDGLTRLLLPRMTREIKLSDEGAHESYPLAIARYGLKSIPQCAMPEKRYRYLKDFRRSLPSYRHKDVIVESVQRSSVVVISGGAGCGKTTQIPQMLYDEEGLFDKNLQVICTQPRRISAISVAQRVAEERGEACGASCGYIVRFDNHTSEKTRIIYMTTGILLRLLQADPILEGVACVIVDEAQERSVETDLCLLLLRDLIVEGKKYSGSYMKLVVMSAASQLEQLMSYFSPEEIGSEVPVVMIRGTLHPVREYYLEDAHGWLGLPPPSIPSSCEGSRPPTVDGETNVCGGGTPTVYEEIMRNIGKSHQVNVCFDLVLDIVREIHRTSRGNSESILIFLPGRSEIFRMEKMIKSSELCKTLFLIKLHSSITAEELSCAFIRPPKGFRKVVLSTNIAEASITIDDIVYVIDSCLTREQSYDPEGNMMHWRTSLISRANGRQRCGLAGRCRPGVCFHLLPHGLYEKLPEFQTPDILKVPLEGVCLNLKALRPNEACMNIFRRCLDVPSECSVSRAVELLKNIGALTPDMESLTYIGSVLSRLPLHPLLGRMLIVASCLGVLDPIATIAAFLSSKGTLFILHESQEEKEKFIKFIHSIDNSFCSDHLLILKIFDVWKGSGVDANHLFHGYVSGAVLQSINQVKNELVHIVCDSVYLQGLRHPMEYASRNSKNIGLVRFAALWSCYPKIASLEYSRSDDCQPQLLCWDDEFSQTLYTSVLHMKRRKDLNDFAFVFYFERMLTERGFTLCDVTAVTPVEVALCLRELTLLPIKDVPPELLSSTDFRMTPLFPFTFHRGERRRDMGVLFFDGGKKAFVTSMRVAETILNVRNCVNYFFQLSIADGNVGCFPDSVVDIIVQTISHPLNDTTDRSCFIGSDPCSTWVSECGGLGGGDNND
ncbi:unnamed protein product [Trypanosoma congolense IL3000]|uniref:WGS project CAEQ00000000 data, annotated contig 1307 n=1 Tax=Trypanosoma congolense (strain IL3000) TaxID=1068625 RepID=F9W5C0_TRYCI|nr:unnamed protein product [Trypanosoma congolense IL3000]